MRKGDATEHVERQLLEKKDVRSFQDLLPGIYLEPIFRIFNLSKKVWLELSLGRGLT